MCHNKHSHFALTDIVHSGYCGLAISICVWQHTVAKTEVLKQASWLPCRNTRQSIEVDQLLNGFKPIEIRLRGIDSKGGISVSLAFQQLLHHLYLYLCLNHHQMIYINSIVAVFSAFWFYQICIGTIFCIFPIVPLWIILTFELTGHYIYGKIFGKIRKKPPILTALLTTTRMQHVTRIPKFDTMRMYKRRKKKSTK